MLLGDTFWVRERVKRIIVVKVTVDVYTTTKFTHKWFNINSKGGKTFADYQDREKRW